MFTNYPALCDEQVGNNPLQMFSHVSHNYFMRLHCSKLATWKVATGLGRRVQGVTTFALIKEFQEAMCFTRCPGDAVYTFCQVP